MEQIKPHNVDRYQAIRGVPVWASRATLRGMAKPPRSSELKRMVGLRLKAARLALGVERQDVLAAKLNVAPSAYNNWETGLRLADVTAIVRLLTLTGIGPDWVFGGTLRGISFELAPELEAIATELGAIVGEPVQSPRVMPPAVRRRRPKHQTIHERQRLVE